jgi:hypothetical protein
MVSDLTNLVLNSSLIEGRVSQIVPSLTKDLGRLRSTER